MIINQKLFSLKRGRHVIWDGGSIHFLFNHQAQLFITQFFFLDISRATKRDTNSGMGWVQTSDQLVGTLHLRRGFFSLSSNEIIPNIYKTIHLNSFKIIPNI